MELQEIIEMKRYIAEFDSKKYLSKGLGLWYDENTKTEKKGKYANMIAYNEDWNCLLKVWFKLRGKFIKLSNFNYDNDNKDLMILDSFYCAMEDSIVYENDDKKAINQVFYIVYEAVKWYNEVKVKYNIND